MAWAQQLWERGDLTNLMHIKAFIPLTLIQECPEVQLEVCFFVGIWSAIDGI